MNSALVLLLLFTALSTRSEALPLIILSPQHTDAPVHGDARFTVVVQGSPPFSYQWKHASTDLVGASSSTLVLTNLRPQKNGGKGRKRVTSISVRHKS